jgi:DUF4097 and DUF4098 domain-containing protein YvlB
MSEEQKDILQMVADGKITADDGAKLLEALSKGDRKRKEMESPARRVRAKKRIFHERMKEGNFEGVEGLRDIGRMVRGMIHDSIPGPDEEEYVEVDDELLDNAEPLEGPVELAEGTELVLKRRAKRNSHGDLLLNGVEGSTLEIVSDEPSGLRMYQDENTVFLRWDKGDLSLNVPAAVVSVRASIMGGDIELKDVTAKSDIRTKGGDISIYDASRAFRAKTMGGDILITLKDGWNEDSKVATMGGNISINITEKTRADISARTLGGEIRIDDDITGVSESGNAGSARVNIDLTDGEDSPELRAKTMGGNISITRSEETPAEAKGKSGKDSGKKKK